MVVMVTPVTILTRYRATSIRKGIACRFGAQATITSVTGGDVWLGIPSMDVVGGRTGRGD